MGTDITYHAERRTACGWQMCVSEKRDAKGRPYPLDFYCGEERNYALFAILAGVQRMTNGGFEPIVAPRGFPADSPVLKNSAREPESHSSHNRTWLTLKELLEFPWQEKKLSLSGYVDAENYLQYKLDGRPEFAHYALPFQCHPVTNEKMERLINEGGKTEQVVTFISFGMPYAVFAGPFLTETLPLLAKQGEPENVRLILSFDS